MAVTVEVLLARRGRIPPDSLEAYRASGGYGALLKAVRDMGPEAVVAEVTASGLRGRGGAWFPTGEKLARTRRAGGSPVVVCNADEGEPGTFKDRVLLEEDPHSVLEGLILAGFAIGATEGHIYLRGEYADLLPRLEQAIAQASGAGFLGERIAGTAFTFSVSVHLGAGAYVCGEETALLNSLEGRRGEPRLRPPYPSDCGLHGRPTLVCNVETLANLPVIVSRGAGWFRSLGTPETPGTKLFSIAGDVARPGVVEAPIGVPLDRLVAEAAGGPAGPWPIKWVQVGGAAGGVIPSSDLGVCLSPEDLGRRGLSLGTGALLVVDSRRCTVDVMRSVAAFFARESCGQCVPCRVGTHQVARLLEAIASGSAGPGTVEVLEDVCAVMERASFCGLGQAAPTAVRTTLRHLREEYREHVDHHRCPAGVCRLGGGAISDERDPDVERPERLGAAWGNGA